MPKFITIGYGDRARYERISQTVKDSAHGSDARMKRECAATTPSGKSRDHRAPSRTALSRFGRWGRGLPMKPRISVITLGVADLDRALAFYRDGLGLPTDGIVGREFEHGAVAFFDLSGGLKLALWAQDDIVHDTGLAKTKSSATAVTLGHNVGSKGDVDEVMAQARGAGAVVVKKAAETFYGSYAGYFMDPDGHIWEVVFNPAIVHDETVYMTTEGVSS